MSPPGSYLAVLAYCAWRARDLPALWWAQPVGPAAELAFLVWAAPAILAARRSPRLSDPVRPGILLGALVLCLLATLFQSRIFVHLALALVLVSPLGFRSATTLYLASSASWLPSVGWLIQHQWGFPWGVPQLALALLGLRWGLRALDSEAEG